MPPSSKAQETSRKILDAALDLFREAGFENATMRDIAAKAGVATGAAYYYYASKEAIVMALYERAWEEMQLALEGAVSQARGFEAKLKADAQNPKVCEWENLMAKFQQPLPGSKPGEKWQAMDLAFKLSEQV